MRPLSALDAAFLQLETSAMPMHVGALQVLERPAGAPGALVDRLRAHLAQRLPLLPVLRRRLAWMPLNLSSPVWLDAEPDLNHHVQALALPASAAEGDGLHALCEVAAELHSQPLDRQRPLWRMWVLDGLAPAADGGQRLGLYIQLHHAAVDGQAAVAMAQVMLDLAPDAPPPPLRPSRRPRVTQLGTLDLLRTALGQASGQWLHLARRLPATASALGRAAARALRPGPQPAADPSPVRNLRLAPRTRFNVTVQPGRRLAVVSLPLQPLMDLGHRQGVTLNDLLLYLCSTALRAYLLRHHALPKAPLVAAVPITLRAAGDARASNQASMSLVSLGTHLAEPVARMAHIRAAVLAMKSTVGGLRQVLPTDAPAIGLPWLVQGAVRLVEHTRLADRVPLLANLVISNVPGPTVPLYLAGARLRSNWPASIVAHGLGLNITAQSLDQQLDVGLVADARAVPDLPALAQALQAACDELLAAARWYQGQGEAGALRASMPAAAPPPT